MIVRFMLMRLTIAVMLTGAVAAVAVPFAVLSLGELQQAQEIELSSLAQRLVPLIEMPMLGALPGLLAFALGVAALSTKSLRIPLLLLGALANFVALGILLVLFLSTLGPLYTYEPL